jgi:hypothetical protein
LVLARGEGESLMSKPLTDEERQRVLDCGATWSDTRRLLDEVEDLRAELKREREQHNYLMAEAVRVHTSEVQDEVEALRAERCTHGWRGRPPKDGGAIQMPCPACGARSLFIGDGGYLTCARVPSHGSPGCSNPSVADVVDALKAENERLRRGPYDHPQQQRCKRCGRADGLNCLVSDDLWERIRREWGGVGNVLCLWCMDQLAAQLKLPESQPVTLSFAGKALHGAGVAGWLVDERDALNAKLEAAERERDEAQARVRALRTVERG